MNDTVTNCYIEIYGVRPTDNVIHRTHEIMPEELKSLCANLGWTSKNAVIEVFKWMEKKASIF